MSYKKELDFFRNKIDNIDEAIVELLNERFDIVKNIYKLKKNNDLPIENINRESEVLSKIQKNSKYNNILEIYKKIILISKEIQKDEIKS